jgi:hypothetical protein
MPVVFHQAGCPLCPRLLSLHLLSLHLQSLHRLLPSPHRL